MEWKLTADRPVYLQLLEQFERQLASGEWAAGSRLPSVRELAADAGVNPNTMQRALQELETRGLILTQRTAGRTVTQDAQKLAAVREQLGQALALEYLRGTKALGYTRAQSAQLLQEIEEESI